MESNLLFNQLVYYWIYDVLIGILFGICSMSSEMCILELQPKQHTGKVTGFKGFVKYIFRGFFMALVGMFWTQPLYNSLWYAFAISSIMVMTLSILMLIMTCKHPQDL